MRDVSPCGVNQGPAYCDGIASTFRIAGQKWLVSNPPIEGGVCRVTSVIGTSGDLSAVSGS